MRAIVLKISIIFLTQVVCTQLLFSLNHVTHCRIDCAVRSNGKTKGRTDFSEIKSELIKDELEFALRLSSEQNCEFPNNFPIPRDNKGASNSQESIVFSGADSWFRFGAKSLSICSQPLMEVRESQRCPASLLRSNYLFATTVTGEKGIEGAISYTFELVRMKSCEGDTAFSEVPEVLTKDLPSPILQLGIIPIGDVSNWSVRVRPNFKNGNGKFGAARRIRVYSAPICPMPGNIGQNASENNSAIPKLEVTPSINDGKSVTIKLLDVKEGEVVLCVKDGLGKVCYQNERQAVENWETKIDFSNPLLSGIYNIEMTTNGQVQMTRMIVTK